MPDLTVANTILEQLGGQRFKRMTGSTQFLGDATSLRFKLGSGAKVTHVKITLTPRDTYTVEGIIARGIEQMVAETVEDVYCDQLQEVFTRITGFFTWL